MTAPGLSFGHVVDSYERGRPSWPTAALDLVERELGLDPGDTVLDLGAGTGKLTGLLLERFVRVIAVEPDPSMRARIPGSADVLEGFAEAIPLPHRSVACVFCAEAFHWFDWPRAIPEIERVLRPGGGLVLMWNRPVGGVRESSRWPPGVARLLEELGDPAPQDHQYEHDAWRKALALSSFGPLHDQPVANGNNRVDRQTLIARISSWNPIALLSDDERAKFVDALAAQLPDPGYPAALETHLYWTRLA